MSATTYLRILLLFSSLSIMSIGGGNSVLPEMSRKAVNDYQWLTSRQFSDVFAISQAAPGPSILIVTLIGYKTAGIPGAALATVATILPAALLMYWITRVWQGSVNAPWHRAVEMGLAPIAVGLIFASGYIIARGADHDWRAYLVTAIATWVFTRTKINPVAVMAIAGLLGWLKWI